MELCRCLWTVKSNTSFNNFARILNGSRCFYLTLVHEIGEASISQVNDTISVCFVYPTYRSLSIISIPALLTLCDLLFLFTQVTCSDDITSIMSKAIHSLSVISKLVVQIKCYTQLTVIVEVRWPKLISNQFRAQSGIYTSSNLIKDEVHHLEVRASFDARYLSELGQITSLSEF